MHACQIGYKCPWASGSIERGVCLLPECVVTVADDALEPRIAYATDALTGHLTRFMKRIDRLPHIESKDKDPRTRKDWERTMKRLET